MAIKQFTIGTSKTVNLGNFESHKVEASVVWEVETDKGLTLGDQTRLAQEELRLLLEQTYKAQRKDKPARG